MESVSVGAVEQTLMAELALIGRDEHLQDADTTHNCAPKVSCG